MSDTFIVIGKGGREHALASLLARDNTVYSFGGSDAIQAIAKPLDAGRKIALDQPLDTDARAALLAHPDAVVVFGPEQPMAAGWVDQIRMVAPKARVLGPNQYAAQLESSKWWAKDFMLRKQVPTGAAERMQQVEDFDRFAQRFAPPYVIKADGLAAGKGVAIFEEAAPARDFVQGIVNGKLFGEPQLALIEEFLRGPELSVFLLLDGHSAVQLATARDFKRAYDQDAGPNTGGMGSFTPVPDVTAAAQQTIFETVLQPIISGLQQDGIFYRGFLYVGLMRTASGFKVLEFNVRMGDPETQAVLPAVGPILGPLLSAAADGRLSDLWGRPELEQVTPRFARVASSRSAVCVVLASEAYPGPSTGNVEIPTLSDPAAGPSGADQYVFHAGTARVENGWVTNGGRVLNAVQVDDTLDGARRGCYELVQKLACPGLRYRTDIAATVEAG